jgi:hypothetical protein
MQNRFRAVWARVLPPMSEQPDAQQSVQPTRQRARPRPGFFGRGGLWLRVAVRTGAVVAVAGLSALTAAARRRKPVRENSMRGISESLRYRAPMRLRRSVNRGSERTEAKVRLTGSVIRFPSCDW